MSLLGKFWSCDLCALQFNLTTIKIPRNLTSSEYLISSPNRTGFPSPRSIWLQCAESLILCQYYVFNYIFLWPVWLRHLRNLELQNIFQQVTRNSSTTVDFEYFHSFLMAALQIQSGLTNNCFNEWDIFDVRFVVLTFATFPTPSFCS